MAIELAREMDQGAMLVAAHEPDMTGVCLELCRRWVRARLFHQTFDEVMDLVSDQDRMPQVILDWDAARRDHRVNGLNKKTKNTRLGYPGYFAVGGLVSRLDVIRHVLNFPAVYIYTVVADGRGGHCFSFDTRDRNLIYFFDPNQGGWTIQGEQQQNIEEWWSTFWDASRRQQGNEYGNRNYKDYFHNGTRRLVRYLLPQAV
jgi:hypothetical protein